MSASIYDSAMFRDLFLDREMATLFTDTAELRAMLLVWGALAQAQAAEGLIPEVSAMAIQRAAMEIQVDPAALAKATGQNAVVVPALVTAFREELKAPEHAQWLHYGATSQDIMETGLVLRLRQVLALYETRLIATIKALGLQAKAHADLPMAGRTYGQVATPTTFGAVLASWGSPLIDLLDQLAVVKANLLKVSLSGAAGTLSAMEDKGPAVRAGLAKGLGLSDPGQSWHSSRHPVAGLAAWITLVTGSLAKMAEDLGLMTQTGLGEVRLPSAGGSSTMPQKQNPVMPSVMVAIASHAAGLNGVMQGAIVHRQQRDGAAWISEWMSLPQMCLGLGRSLILAQELAEGIAPDPAAMLAQIDDGTGLIYAEALSFRLAGAMPRPEAQSVVKALCKEVLTAGQPLPELAAAAYPEADLSNLFAPSFQLGRAPAEARAFAAAASRVAK